MIPIKEKQLEKRLDLGGGLDRLINLAQLRRTDALQVVEGKITRETFQRRYRLRDETVEQYICSAQDSMRLQYSLGF